MTTRAALITPKDPQFARLNPFDRYRALKDCYDAERRLGSRARQDVIRRWGRYLLNLRAHCAVRDPVWDFQHNFTVESKGHGDTLLDPFASQRKVINYIEECRADKTIVHPHGRPVRLGVLKGRQQGISRICLGVTYREARNHRNHRGLVMAHDGPTATELFGTVRKFYENDPLHPAEERQSQSELALKNGSRIFVRSGGVTVAHIGHGYSWHSFLLSEAGRLRNPDVHDLVTGIVTAMPHGDQAFTIFIFESTGYGDSGWFADTTMHLLDVETGDEEVDSELEDYHLIFLPAWERFDAKRPFSDAKARVKFEKSLGEDEKLILEKYTGTTLEFLNWRRYVFKTEIHGRNQAERKRMLAQQYPLKPMDAFQSHGKSTFKVEIIDTQLAKCPKPTFVGDIVGTIPYHEGRHAEKTPVPQFSPDDRGALTIWRDREEGHEYTAGLDCARGTAHGSWSVISIFNRNVRQFVARWRCKADWHVQAVAARFLSVHYNNMLLVPEVNFNGADLTAALAMSDREEFLYRRLNPSQVDARMLLQDVYGFLTTHMTKPQLVGLAKERLDLEPQIFTDDVMLREMRRFEEERTPSGDLRYSGQKHGKDFDTMISGMLALVGDLKMPVAAKPEPEEERRPQTPGELWDAMVRKEAMRASGDHLSEWEATVEELAADSVGASVAGEDDDDADWMDDF